MSRLPYRGRKPYNGLGEGMGPVAYRIALACLYLVCGLGVAALLLLGCGASPTGIEEVSQSVTTAYGTVTVLGPLDPDEVRAGVERGYQDVEEQGYTLRADGLTVAWSDATNYHDAYWPRYDLVELPNVAALPHAIGHRACHQLHRPAWCCPRVGHDLTLDCREVG